MIKSRSGFTIVEMVVVIAVIGILAAITIVTYDNIQAQARDSKRISDLARISDAIQLYRQKNGNDVQTGSGCGSGNGWFNYQDPAVAPGGAYEKSVLSCLVNAGYLDESFIDPTGCTTTWGSKDGSKLPSPTCTKDGYAYMKYSCPQNGVTVTYIYARLEGRTSTQEVLDSGGCNASFVGDPATYKMNYFVKVD